MVGSRERRVQLRATAVDPSGPHANTTGALYVVVLGVADVKADVRGYIQLLQYETKALRLRLVTVGALGGHDSIKLQAVELDQRLQGVVVGV